MLGISCTVGSARRALICHPDGYTPADSSVFVELLTRVWQVTQWIANFQESQEDWNLDGILMEEGVSKNERPLLEPWTLLVCWGGG